jgi:hypothetical protein
MCNERLKLRTDEERPLSTFVPKNIADFGPRKGIVKIAASRTVGEKLYMYLYGPSSCNAKSSQRLQGKK